MFLSKQCSGKWMYIVVVVVGVQKTFTLRNKCTILLQYLQQASPLIAPMLSCGIKQNLVGNKQLKVTVRSWKCWTVEFFNIAMSSSSVFQQSNQITVQRGYMTSARQDWLAHYCRCLHRMQRKVYETILCCPSVRLSFHLSVPASAHSSKPAAAGLLLWARREGDIDRLLQHAAGDCGQCHIFSMHRQLNTHLLT